MTGCFSDVIPLSLYIHLPWCISKCPYCDFNSHASDDVEALESDYIDALIRDLEFELPTIRERTVNTIFIGGGTPSLFSGKAISKLIREIKTRLNLRPDCEITLEANPGAVEADRFKAYKESGVNRLSVGVQSLDERMLKRLGRTHRPQEAIQAVQLAHDCGFQHLNLDMMFALPEQSKEAAIQDLKSLIELKPTHISWYQLTVEPNTVFYSKPPNLPHADRSAEIESLGLLCLQEHHYTQYEVSAYGNTPCQHNLNYWQFGDYLGIGAGAHGKITDALQGTIYRYARVKIPKHYMNKAGGTGVYAEQRCLNQKQIVFEFMLNALRLKHGFHEELFVRHTGMPINTMGELLMNAQEKQLLVVDQQRIAPSDRGWRYLNDLIEIFL